MQSPAPIITEVTLALLTDGDQISVGARLGYDAGDPYAVSLEMVTGPEDVVVWSFSRDLLSAGTREAVGDGDIRISPVRRGGLARISLELRTPTGEALLEASLAEIVEFLSASYEVVPSGTESSYLDLDGLLARLLAA
jgi:Streptomyces sporulation and cell division protein, SsgA